MRLGLSNKITQPHLRGAVSAGIVRIPITLEMDATYRDSGPFALETLLPYRPPASPADSHISNSDGRHYQVNFPEDWVKFGAISYASDAAAAAGFISDPFAGLREAGGAKIDASTGGAARLPAINANLDITINVPDTVTVGGAAFEYAFGFGTLASLVLWLSKSIPYSTFTEEAAKNLRITINNKGVIGGSGGVGGYGDNTVLSEKFGRNYAGGGGSGGGIHIESVPLNHWEPYTPSTGNPASAAGNTVYSGAAGGAGGHGTFATAGTQGSAGEDNPPYELGPGGAGGLGSGGRATDFSATNDFGGGAGGAGGTAIAIKNPQGSTWKTTGDPVSAGGWADVGEYASDWVNNWSNGGGPELIVNNQSTGRIRGGGGGGGGGGNNGNGGAGGAQGLSGTFGSGPVTGVNIVGVSGGPGDAVGDRPYPALISQNGGSITRNNYNSHPNTFFGNDGDFTA